MYQTGPSANDGKKVESPRLPSAVGPLSSTCGIQSELSLHSKYFPQPSTFARQHASPSDGSRGSRGHAYPSHRALTSSNDAVTTQESLRMARRFFLNQPVNVNIEGCGWLIGTVVFFARTIESLTGSTVRVRYSIPAERNERERDFPNHPDYIRPL